LIASNSQKKAPAFYILALVNERLEKCRRIAENLSLSCSPSRMFIAPNSSSNQLSANFSTRIENARENYHGFVCAQVVDQNEKVIVGAAEFPPEKALLPQKTMCKLAVWMQPNKLEGAWSDEVVVETGNND